MAPDQIVFEKLLRGGYRAKLGPWDACGPTKTAAQAALLAIFANWPTSTDPVIRTDTQGGIWLLYFEWTRWSYKTPTGSAVIVNGDKREALRAMEAHIAQYY